MATPKIYIDACCIIEAIKGRRGPEQSRRFIEKARQLEADEDRSNADALLGKLARTPPDPKPAKKPKAKKPAK